MKTLIYFLVVAISFVSFINLAAGCDESEMQSMMTGNVVAENSIDSSLEIFSLIKELLIIIVLVLLVIFLIKQINKK